MRLVKCDSTRFNSKIAAAIDAEFMKLADQAASKDNSFSDYCVAICKMDARYCKSMRIWRKFSAERKEATYETLVNKIKAMR
jgi:hypothetical protein